MTKPSTTTQTRELKPCPAGHPIAQVCDSDRKMFYVVCIHAECFWTLGEGYDRDAMPDHAFRSEEEAIEAWNTRASADEVTRLREALESALAFFEQHKERHLVSAHFYAVLADIRKALKGESDGTRTNSASQ